jgi:hypothetical protein
MEPYDAHPVTTQTFVIYTDIFINGKAFFEHTSCVPILHKPRIDNKKMIIHPEEKVENGDIVFTHYCGREKGTSFKKGSTRKMRNCMTLIMVHWPKYYNVNISEKGNFQLTGCTSQEPVEFILTNIWNRLQGIPLSLKNAAAEARCYITCRMCNIVFKLPFCVNRKRLNETIKMWTSHISIYEPSVSYVGVNIKIESQVEKIEQVVVTKMIFSAEAPARVVRVPFSEYLDTLSAKEQIKKKSKSYKNSFLVFYSGTTIMSGKISHANRQDSYIRFCESVFLHQDLFKEEN